MIQFCVRHLFIFALVLAFHNVVEAKTNEPARQVAQEVAVLVEDSVFKLEGVENGYRVMFKTHSAIYYLHINSQFYEQALSILKASKQHQSKIKVRVDVNTMQINEITLNLK